MTDTYLTLKGVSHILPDGRTLFTDLNEQFDLRPTGLVGRNGTGKTVLARILAGELLPTDGHCLRSGNVHYLAQQVGPPEGDTVAEVAGVQHILDALSRIELGSTALADFEAIGDQWDLRQRFCHELERNELGHLDPLTPAKTLSGGESMRIALIGAMLSEADYLILDEPSNHLDRLNRRALIEQLQRWSRGLIVISHDRQLLEVMERTLELSSQGLSSYGGNYSFYAQSKTQERQSARQNLERLKLERQREERAVRKQRERQERRQARGNRRGKEANQAKILLDGEKERSENSTGKLHQNQAARRAQLNQQVREAAQEVEEEVKIALHTVPVTHTAKRRVAELSRVVLPFVEGATQNIDLILGGQQRIGVVGANGCGKSTLLRVMAGQIAPREGFCEVVASCAYLDQRLFNLCPEKTVLEQLQAANRTATEGDLRMLLAQLGLDAQKIIAASGSLSGGERLKGALACMLYSDPSPQLLLLDEPNNHLDFPTVQALEFMLGSYQGALMVVSHDDTFMENLRLTDYLYATTEGWSLEPI